MQNTCLVHQETTPVSDAEHVCIQQQPAGEAAERLGQLHTALLPVHHLRCSGADQLFRLRLVLGGPAGGGHQLLAH